MKKLAIAGMIVTSLALAACQATETTATTKADTTASIGKPPLARDFTANLVRVQEFVRADARGQTKLQLSSDGSELRYELTVENLENFTWAHIHLAPDVLKQQTLLGRIWESSPKHEHGPIVVSLTDFMREGITVDGVLAKGTIRKSDLIGPLAGYPLSLLAELMERGDTYIALHVLQSVPPNNKFCCPVGLRGSIKAERSQ
jgi:hypothetical protein